MSTREPALGTREAGALRRARFVTTLMDDAVTLPVVRRRVGLDALLGLLPVSGDLVTGVLSLYVVFEAWRCGVRKRTLLRMLANVAVDVGVGSVPVVGDLFDVVWRANRRNLDLLESHLGVDG